MARKGNAADLAPSRKEKKGIGHHGTEKLVVKYKSHHCFVHLSFHTGKNYIIKEYQSQEEFYKKTNKFSKENGIYFSILHFLTK